ncbi:hypothetical protein Lser_V15G35186 [Lactuca serriola]
MVGEVKIDVGEDTKDVVPEEQKGKKTDTAMIGEVKIDVAPEVNPAETEEEKSKRKAHRESSCGFSYKKNP